MNPQISIIICTCNRAESLRQTLAAIRGVAVPEDMPAELLVVDNGSTDRTATVVRRAELAHMPLRYVHEPRRGKGYAYNTGMRAAGGCIFLFTDDDVHPPVNWIEGMCRPIAAGEADAVAGGVRLPPHLERPWLRGFLRTCVACTDVVAGAEPVQLIGADMAFGRHVLEKVPGFDPELGPGALGFADEALFAAQLRQAGFRIKGRWDVAVEHHFGEQRMNRQGFAAIARRMGRSRAYLQYHWEHRDVAAPRLAEWWVRMKLMVSRGLSRASRAADDPTPREVAYLTHIHLFRQYRIERRRPRNYERFGLVKQRGVLDAVRRLEALST